MRSAAVAALALTLAACADDEITRPREDAGIGPSDSGIEVPLELQPGMTFGYRGILTYRESLGAERNATWTMTIRIETVDDRGGDGESTLTFKVVDYTQDIDDWDQPRDFDSWVGRLGPSIDGEQPSSEAATASLSDPPSIPPAPTPQDPKVIPSGGSFFIDTRALDRMRLAWTEAHPDQQPQATDPPQNGGFYGFAYSGPEPSLVYFPASKRTRRIALDYNTKGFLRRLEEKIGDSSDPPSADCRIELTTGP